MTYTEHANAIIAFLQYIENKDDAIEFVRIAVDAQENAAYINREDYSHSGVLEIIQSVDKRLRP